MKYRYLGLAGIALAVAACDNPADKTTDAKVSAPVEKASLSTEGGTKYVFTSNSEVNFIASKITKSHHGGFKKFTGHFTVKDGAPVGNDHKVVIDTTSVWADDEKLTGHLKTADFFDVEKYPTSTFDVTDIHKDTDTAYTVAGNFSLHGKTKNISFPATVTLTGDAVMIHATFDINRKDFDIVYPGKAEDLIRDNVVIELKLEAKPAT